MIKSFFLGLLSLIALFFLCSVTVVGVKSVFAKLFPKPKPQPVKTVKKDKPKKTTKSITVNPEEIDRIYVKKVS